MATQAQIIANKINAHFSTGPKTAEGKANSSCNHVKFGFTGKFFVAEGEDQDQFDQLVADLEQEHQPSTPTEKILVRNMAQHHWLMQRAILMQDICFSSQTGLCHDEKQLALMIRYQTTHQRAFHKCLKELLTLRAQRSKERLDEAALCQRAEDSRIGFESQERKERAQDTADFRKAKAEARKNELHEAKMHLLMSKTAHQELKNQQLRSKTAHLVPEEQVAAA
ncbi:MAG: hypothetical protein JOZ62_12055 [Acidobacteriaceae bacterium]|nr:hypothetical protein [Acidobacteriaceae bacterium]